MIGLSEDQNCCAAGTHFIFRTVTAYNLASSLFSSHSNISVFACISPDTLSIVPSVKLVRSNLNSNWYSRSEVAHTFEQSSLRRSRGDTGWQDLVRATSGDQENI